MRSTTLYQIFVIKGMQFKGVRILYLISFFFFGLAAEWCPSFFNTVFDLDQMEKSQVRIIEVKHVRRSVCGSKITVQLKNGDQKTYRRIPSESEIEFLANGIGKEVTIWTQPHFELNVSCFKAVQIMQMEYEGKLVGYDYSPIKQRLLQSKANLPYEFAIFLVLALLPLFYVFFRFRHDVKIKPQPQKELEK
jgi:small nuclear ribonucleoprotein (snRNP)-like protein